jgi:hypothetical protein
MSVLLTSEKAAINVPGSVELARSRRMSEMAFDLEERDGRPRITRGVSADLFGRDFTHHGDKCRQGLLRHLEPCV